MYPHLRSASVSDRIRARLVSWLLGRRLWSRIYRFHTEIAWKMGVKGQPLPWHEPVAKE